jgi:alpha-D-ribose 1-methylphosphonate 5-triphosphate synthase subunit PhnI
VDFQSELELIRRLRREMAERAEDDVTREAAE